MWVLHPWKFIDCWHPLIINVLHDGGYSTRCSHVDDFTRNGLKRRKKVVHGFGNQQPLFGWVYTEVPEYVRRKTLTAFATDNNIDALTVQSDGVTQGVSYRLTLFLGLWVGMVFPDAEYGH